MNKVKYLKHCVFHPFDGFYEAKNRGMGSGKLTAVLYVIYGLLSCIGAQYTGFVMNMYNPREINSLTIFISSISIFLLFSLGNWTVTTLFDGKGKLKDVLMVTAYSLIPVIITRIIVIIASNFVISEETVILSAVTAFGWVWFGFMMLAGLCTIHEYGLFKNLVTLLVSAAAVAIIVFLLVLLISLVEQMGSFFIMFFKELSRRI